ncbi:unnamed protein product [Litomosoides sigmodontis]|uniref:Uncharacterized protein n=1 Tax=Litomosoides sigmodontis TaxID=42156 RepID=A0A3P6SK07_LITSI|nr:unnamed protein product [Litomosoides sigmodontis]
MGVVAISSHFEEPGRHHGSTASDPTTLAQSSCCSHFPLFPHKLQSLAGFPNCQRNAKSAKLWEMKCATKAL